MKLLRRRREEPRFFQIVRVYVFIALVVQMVLGIVMLGLGIFYFLIFENYILFPLVIALPMFIIAPQVTALGGLLSLLIAYIWLKTIANQGDDHLALIASAIIFLVLFTFLVAPLFIALLFVSLHGTNSVLLTYYEILGLFGPFSLFLYQMFSLPAFFVLLAGGCAEVYKMLIKPPPPPLTVRESPVGIRTMHGLVAQALRRDQDRVQETDR